MLTIDDLGLLVNTPFDEARVESIVGMRGRETLRTEFEPGHPEDELVYYVIEPMGLAIVFDYQGLVCSIFCMIDGEEDISGYPWSFRNGICGSSRRADVIAAFGTPESSGGSNATVGGWDRFVVPALGRVHIQYKPSENGVSIVTYVGSLPQSFGVA